MIRDEELCRQLKEGNEAALEALVHRHHGAVFAFLHRLSGSRHTADDLAQECFIRLCTRIHHYRYPEPFTPWLYTVAHNLYRNWRQGAYQRLVVPDAAGAAEHQSAPIDLMERQTERLSVIAALAQLDELHRSVLVLRYYHDLKVDDVARILGIPAGTVKSRLSTAVKRLRLIMEERGRAEHA